MNLMCGLPVFLKIYMYINRQNKIIVKSVSICKITYNSMKGGMRNL